MARPRRLDRFGKRGAQGMPRRVAYVNARLLSPVDGLDALGAVLTEGVTIADAGPRLFNDGLPADAHVIDVGGHCLCPGLVDMRVATGEPGEEHKETIGTAGRAAAAGGVTAFACLPGTTPPIDDISGVELIARRAREEKLVKVYAQAAVTRNLEGRDLTEMGLLAEAGVVAFTDGTRAVADAAVMRRALSYALSFDLLIVQHPEDPSLASGGHMNAGETATRLGLVGIPPVAEVMMIERDLRLVALTGGRYHVAHVSTVVAVEAIRLAKRQGLRVTCDTAPPYFSLTEADVGDYRTFAKLSPPLRTEADRQAVVEGLADGTIDAIASDHAPQDQDTKRLPFGQAAPGAIGLETLLPLTLALVEKGHLDLMAAFRCLSTRPAGILGLPVPCLRPGARADFVVVDLGRPWRVDASALVAKSKNTPFDHWPVTGRVLHTVVDGRMIHSLESDGNV